MDIVNILYMFDIILIYSIIKFFFFSLTFNISFISKNLELLHHIVLDIFFHTNPVVYNLIIIQINFNHQKRLNFMGLRNNYRIIIEFSYVLINMSFSYFLFLPHFVILFY